MKKALRLCLLLMIASAALTIFVSADTGPKPQLIVRVKNAPDEPYYLDILAEGTYEPDNGFYSGLEWSYSKEEIAALDTGLLDALLAAVPQDWHACTAEGSAGAPMWGQLYAESVDSDGNPLHTFGYVGLSDTYRILMVTSSGGCFLSDVCERQHVLQSSVTVDWADKSVTIPPSWVGYTLQFLATFLPTLIIEGALLLFFGYSWRKNWKVFLATNTITQGLLALYFSIQAVQNGVVSWYFFLFLPAEVIIALLEAGIYRRRLTGRPEARAVVYGLTANACSALLGWYIMEPLWRFVVSIS